MTGDAIPLASVPRGPMPLPELVAHVVLRLPSLAAAYGPGARVVPAVRERAFAEAARGAGAPAAAWTHQRWADFLGSASPDVADALVSRVARFSTAGTTLPAGLLDDLLPDEAQGAIEAALALGVIAGRVERAALRLSDVVLRRPELSLRRLRQVPDLLADAALVALFTPLATPVMGFAGVLSLLTRLAPALPPVELVVDGQADGAEAGLLSHLLASAAPTYFSNALVRTVALGLPSLVGLGVRAEGQEATIWVGRGRIVVADGIGPDVVAVLDGAIEPLLQTASGTLVRDLRDLQLRPS